VDSHSTTDVVWSGGINYDGPGGTWWARNR